MTRSLKKGPYVQESLQRKIDAMNASNDRSVHKTWSRRSTVTPDMVGHTLAVHTRCWPRWRRAAGQAGFGP